MARKLPPVPGCTEPVSCEAPDQATQGLGLIVRNDETNCQVELLGDGIPVTLNDLTKMMTGSASSPIKLPLLQQLVGSSTPFICTFSKAGTMMIFPAYEGATAKILISKNGSWTLGNIPATACHDPNDICTDCESGWVAGFRLVTREDGTTTLCLTRIDLDTLNELTPDAWEDTNTAEIAGAGSAAAPYAAHVKISADFGNILEARGDGLFVACCDSYYLFTEDPLD